MKSETATRLLFHLSGLSLTQRRSTISFFFNDTATTKIYTLSLHDALPISRAMRRRSASVVTAPIKGSSSRSMSELADSRLRSEEHTSELQSRRDLVCRLLLEKKNSCFLNDPGADRRGTEAGAVMADEP